MCSVVFFLRLKTDELIEEHGHKVLCILPCNCHFIPNELVWSQAKGYYSSNVGANGCGMDVVKKMWGESLEQICMFVLVLNKQASRH
jgi:hypothetical protein